MSKSWSQAPVYLRCLCCLISICASEDFFFFFLLQLILTTIPPKVSDLIIPDKSLVLLTHSTVQQWATSALISIYWCHDQFMYLRSVGKSIIVPQNIEVTFVCPHTHTNKRKCIYTLEYTYRTHTCTDALVRDYFRMKSDCFRCVKIWASWCLFCIGMCHLFCCP